MAKKSREPPKFSEYISSFCRMLEEAQRDYTWNKDEQARMEALQQDYLHKLELGDLDYRERAKVATKLAEVRKTRRNCKDTCYILEPLVSFLDGEKGKNLKNLLSETLGKTRRCEEKMDGRVYQYRVLDEAPIRKG